MTKAKEEEKETREARKRAAAAYAETLSSEHLAPYKPSQGQEEKETVPAEIGKGEQAAADDVVLTAATAPAKEVEAPESAIPVALEVSLEQQLESARKQAEEYLDGWQRERAEFANYRKRIERDQSQMSQNITANIIKKYLVVLDDIERALKTRPVQGEAVAWSEGIDLIYRKLQNILESERIQPIDAANKVFNPMYHEAITYEDSPDHKSGHVIEVVQNGYMLGDRVIRPALVRVAR